MDEYPRKGRGIQQPFGDEKTALLASQKPVGGGFCSSLNSFFFLSYMRRRQCESSQRQGLNGATPSSLPVMRNKARVAK
jgi:hypothetical protein